MVDSHTYKPRTESLLYMLSLAQCANPECKKALVVPLSNNEIVISEGNIQTSKQIAHIHSERANGPRYAPGMSIDELRSYPNLIVLCPECHGKIDDFPDRYPASTLLQWKELRETEALNSFIRNKSLLATIISTISCCESFDESPDDEEVLATFEVEEKICFNDLKETGYVIREYSMFQGSLFPLYRTLEEQGSFKKVSLLRYIKKEYVAVRGVYLSKYDSNNIMEVVRNHSEDIFNDVHDRLIQTVKSEAVELLSHEDIVFGSLVVMVDAFIDCKILERPR